ncbi:MAG: hypothetical protein Q4P72_03475 [Eubacteriales bacterium]|nr:hypothetical protein [Eubacteriales bacterium]
MEDMTDEQYRDWKALITYKTLSEALKKLEGEVDEKALEKIKKVFEEIKEKADH